MKLPPGFTGCSDCTDEEACAYCVPRVLRYLAVLAECYPKVDA